VGSVAWRGDDSLLATLSYGGGPFNFRIWDASTGEQVYLMNQTGAYAYSVAWDSNSDRLAMPRGAGAGIWELPHLDAQESASGDIGEIIQSVWSPDGQFLAGVGVDERVLIWDTSSSDFRKPLYRELVEHIVEPFDPETNHWGYI